MTADHFFDTYALVKYVEGDAAYERFQDEPIITALYNIYELVYYLLRDHDRETAEATVDRLHYNLLRPEEADLYRAAAYKLEHRDRQLSYVDCLGYVLARANDLMFLTGDQEFEGMADVEHVP